VGRLTLVTTWGARLAWLATAVVGGAAIGAALAERSGSVQAVATIGAWIAWALGALALAVPSVPSLTVARVVVPGALAVSVAAAVGGAEPGALLALVLPAIVSAVLTGAAETGRVWVQSSAYGDEQRFPLRPPLGYLAACVVTWLIWVAAVIVAPLAWAGRAWIPAAVATVLGVLGAVVLPRRWHQLSRRWVVTVPAGLVVHDPVVLGETFMLTRRQIGAVALADLGPGAIADAADLTGPTPGLAVEVRLREQATALLAPTPTNRQGRAVHLHAFVVSPSRPGALLADVARRGLPTG